MFKKIIANLPFNPSLLEEAIAYQQKVKNESRLRLIGLLVVLLSTAGQLYFWGRDWPLLAINAAIFFIATWLYVRSVIIASELEQIRRSFVSSGGM